MAHLRIAAVQLEYQPVMRTTSGAGWLLDEPFSPEDPLTYPIQSDFFLSFLRGQHKDCRAVCEKAMQESRHAYTGNLIEKLREIMSFCFKRGVDLVVFPEYSVPIGALDALRMFSNRIAIVAGVGYLLRLDIGTFRDLGIEVEGISQGNNVTVVLSPEKNFLVAKKNPAAHEDIVPGTGPQVAMLKLSKGSFTVGVAICLDFIQEESYFNQRTPDIAIIPSLSKNTAEFVEEIPRNFIRVFANHAAFGGTYIGAPDIKKGLGFVNRNGTKPFSKGLEGIVIVDWDFGNPWETKPSSVPPPDHRLYARAALVYEGRDPEIAQKISRIDLIPSEVSFFNEIYSVFFQKKYSFSFKVIIFLKNFVILFLEK